MDSLSGPEELMLAIVSESQPISRQGAIASMDTNPRSAKRLGGILDSLVAKGKIVRSPHTNMYSAVQDKSETQDKRTKYYSASSVDKALASFIDALAKAEEFESSVEDIRSKLYTFRRKLVRASRDAKRVGNKDEYVGLQTALSTFDEVFNA